MTTRFPAKGMKALLAKFPKAEKLVQLRIFDREGNVLCLEGPITADEASAIARRALGLPKAGDPVNEEPRLCEGGCGCTDSDTALSIRRHGKTICENCAWDHDHGEEDCGWQCVEIPASLRKTHRKGKCGTHCPNPKTWAAGADEPAPLDKSVAEEP